MSRIGEKFKQLKKDGRKGFIAYITAGDPTLKATSELVKVFENEGVDFIELGIPFSDPLADGLVNQLAAMRALESGTTVNKILNVVSQIRKKSEVPIILFTYLNPILKYGLQNFARHAKNAGIDGVLALDLPPEEASDYKVTMKDHGLDTIFLVAPTSTPQRIEKISKEASGFIYCVSRTGVTGIRTEIPKEVPQLVQSIQQVSDLPVAVGFGISNPEQASQLSKVADAIVVGSAIVKQIEKNIGNPQFSKNILRFIKPLVRAVHSQGGNR